MAMFNPSFSKLVRLTKDEKKVLSCLSSGNKSMSDISRATKVPRTTLYTTVDSLLSRGLIEKSKKSNQTIVSLADKEKIDSLIFNESSFVRDRQRKKGVQAGSAELPDTQDFRIIYGLENLVSVYKKICSSRNERVCTIQPTSSMLAVVSKLSPSQIIEANESVKKNKVLFDAIIHQNYMTAYMNKYMAEEGRSQTQQGLLKSLKERLSDTRVIDDQYLNVSSEIFLTSSRLYLLDWKNESCIEIRNGNIVSLIKGMFSFVKAHSVKIDYHKLIADALERAQK